MSNIMDATVAEKGRKFREKARASIYDQPEMEDEEPAKVVTPTPEPGPAPSPTPDKGRVDEDNLTPEEKTYKKRYGDLRTLHQREKEQKDKELAELRTQIETIKNSGQTGVPKSPDDIKRWMQDYPELAAAILHIADEKAKDRLKDVTDKLARVEADSLEVLREKAYLNLKKLHPDVDEIRKSQEFHDWVAKQPDSIQSWFYENDTDYTLAARGIDLFKVETGFGKSKKPKVDERTLAETVIETSKQTAPAVDAGGKKIWKASEIKRMSPEDFEKHEKEIEQANYEGRVVNDLRDIITSH